MASDILNWEVARLNTFSVASTRALNSIRCFVDREMRKWERQGVRVDVRECPAGGSLILHCRQSAPDQWGSGNDLYRKVKSLIANGLADIIIDEYEKFLVVRLIDGNYAYLSEKDRALLKAKALRTLDNGMNNGYSVKRSQRKSRVWAKLSEYLEKEDQIILEGFITFRLKDYLEDLFDFVDHMVKEHLINREYREFLRLLRHLMSRQKCSVPVVNIHRESQGGYRLLDARLEPVGGHLGAFMDRTRDGSRIEVDDLVVSAVVTLAPDRIAWHGDTDNSPCFDLLSDLFEHHLEVCGGCDLERSEP
ncbi:MAG: hypothetical protein GX784_07650 [Firmicutes bacterium]|nr:hypothetical protein [Candidatus Fermentithermobacillaceae bacterium]